MQIQSRMSRDTLLSEALQPTRLNVTMPPPQNPQLYPPGPKSKGDKLGPQAGGLERGRKGSVVSGGYLRFSEGVPHILLQEMFNSACCFPLLPTKGGQIVGRKPCPCCPPFIRVPLVCDCSPSCSPPALHPSASPQLRNQLWLAKSTLHQQSSRPWRETLPSIPLGPPCLRQESQGRESRGELIENRFLSALPG